MQEPHDVFKTMLKMAGENYRKSQHGKLGDNEAAKASSTFQLLLLGILLFVGADAMKVLFRTNFGSKSISLLRIGIASLIFFLWGVICLAIAMFIKNQRAIDFFLLNGGQPALYIIAVFYFVLSFSVFRIGSVERSISKQSERFIYDPGISLLFGYLVSAGFSELKVQMMVEPFFIFSVGIALSCINLFLGVPIVICGISLLAYELYEKYFLGTDHIYQTLKNKGFQQDKNFSEVS
jgi:hypothetical protein